MWYIALSSVINYIILSNRSYGRQTIEGHVEQVDIGLVRQHTHGNNRLHRQNGTPDGLQCFPWVTLGISRMGFLYRNVL